MSEPTGWRKSSLCDGGKCVEVKFVDAGGVREVLVRKSERDEALRFEAAEWAAFLAGARLYEFDLPE